MALPRITDDERRRRIARRHAISPAHRVASVEAAARAMTVLHASEAATVHLSAAARVDGITSASVDEALYDERTLVKQLAMRRTLFVFPRDLLPAAWGSASARVAASLSRRVAKDVVAAGIAEDGDLWLASACSAVLRRLERGPATTSQLRKDVPELAGSVERSPGTTWGRPVNVGPWVLTQLGLQGDVVRARNAGHWRLNKPTWTLTSDWLGDVPEALDEQGGYAELVRRWLHTFGPGTTEDVVWWLGATKTAVRRALADVAAEEVELEDSTTGWVLPGDDEESDPVEPWAALLPALDPTTMGWKARSFYLDAGQVPYLFDTNGNAGTTAWWNGRVVGCWVQDDAGVVKLSLLEDVGQDGMAALESEAARLTAWLDGTIVLNPYTSHQMKQARLP